MERLFPVEQDRNDDYMTPRWVFDALDLEFDLDVAAPLWDTNVPAAQKFTQADDGLTQPWKGRVWMNPPFSNITPWVARFQLHGHGVALLPVTKSDWFVSLWRSHAGIVFPNKVFRTWSSVPVGKDPQIQYMLFFAAFGSECIEALQQIGKLR